VVVLWFIQGGALAERKKEFDDLVSQLSETQLKTTVVEASMKEEKGILLKECTELEEEDGVVTEEMNKLRGQMDALGKVIAEEEAKLAAVNQESADLPDRLAALQLSLGEAQGKLAPFQKVADELKAKRAGLDQKLLAVRPVIDDLQTKLGALQDEREAIRRDYEKRSSVLRERIEEPPWVYYGDKVRTKVMNVRPSMTGVFLPVGVGSGVKRGMEFLVRRLNPATPTNRSWRFKLKIVQSDYSFAMIMPEFGDQDIPMQAGEEVEMERSGNLAREESENDADTSAVSP